MARKIWTSCCLFLILGFVQAESVEEQLFNVTSLPTVKVFINKGDIVFKGWNKKERVLVRSITADASVRPRISQDGNTVILREAKANPQFFCESSDCSIRYEIFLPSESRVNLILAFGNIVADGLSGFLDLKTVMGGIRLSLDKPKELIVDAVGGTVECSFREAFDGKMKVKAMEGRIDVLFKKGCDARISAQTMGGTIKTGPAMKTLNRQDFFGIRRLTGTLGQGVGSIDIFTYSGVIDLK